MNLEVDVFVNEGKVASKRSWMSEPLAYNYPAILVYDVKAKKFSDQIVYRPGPIPIVKGNQVGRTYIIPEEFRLEFHLTLDPAAQQRTTSEIPLRIGETVIYWNILKGVHSMIL